MTAAQRTEASPWRPAYLGIFGACSTGSVSFRSAPGSNVRRWVLNWLNFQLSSGCDAAGSPRGRPSTAPSPRDGRVTRRRGGPFTTGAENCMEVFVRIRTTKSRISTYRARRSSASVALSLRDAGAGNAFHMACSLAMGPTSARRGWVATADSPRSAKSTANTSARPLSLARRWRASPPDVQAPRGACSAMRLRNSRHSRSAGIDRSRRCA